MDAEAVPGEEGEIAAQKDQRAVEHVNDVQHAPHQRESHCEAGVKRSEDDPVHQNLQVGHRNQGPPAGSSLRTSPCKGEVDSICPGLARGQMLSGGGPALGEHIWWSSRARVDPHPARVARRPPPFSERWLPRMEYI